MFGVGAGGGGVSCQKAAEQRSEGGVMEVPRTLGCNDLLMTSGHRAESFLSPQVKGQTSHSLSL